MVIAIVLIWVVLGLGVFFVAMRGGRSKIDQRGARQALHTDRSEIGGTAAEGGGQVGQRGITLAVVVLFAFGLAVPAIVLAFNGDHKASVAVGGLHLNAQQERGRELFARSCAVCHTLAATKSVGRIGPNLDVRVGADISTAAGRKALVLSAITEGRARGLGQMPASLYQGKEAEEVAAFVAAVAGH
jgi:mono/diheme cytochrome c family protein